MRGLLSGSSIPSPRPSAAPLLTTASPGQTQASPAERQAVQDVESLQSGTQAVSVGTAGLVPKTPQRTARLFASPVCWGR